MASAPGVTGLIDTNILIDALRNRAQAVGFLVPLQSASVAHISIISAMELVAGCRNSAELGKLQLWLGGLTVLPLTPAMSQEALRLMETFTLSHGLDIPDALIAATAILCGLTLYTMNVRHFQMLPGLVVVKPY